jgi:hypothetical protein
MIPLRIGRPYRIRGVTAEQATTPLMKKSLPYAALFLMVLSVFVAATFSQSDNNPGPTTRSFSGAGNAPAGNVTVNIPPIQVPPANVVVAPDPIKTIDLTLMNYQGATVRVNVKMISAVVPYTMDVNGTNQTGSAVYCWPADIWYASADVTTLTTQLAAQGWGSGAPLVVTARMLPTPNGRAPETPKPYTNPVNNPPPTTRPFK